jgi:hypothetical protein
MAVGRDDLVITSGITTAVVAVVSPHDPWQQPMLRAVGKAVGIAVGVAASTIALRVTRATVAAAAQGVVGP